MAALGVRQVIDVMAELSFHLVEPIVNQSLASPIGPGNGLTISLNPSTPLPATEYLYPGALIVVGWHGADAEVGEVIAVTGNNTFTGNLVNAHAAGESVFGATFPTQEATDPIFTQAEIQGYIAQAQNEFLTKVPLIFELFPNQTVLLGQIYQTVPDTAIEMERVSLNSGYVQFNIGTISRSGNTVTAVIPTSTSSDNWTPGLPIVVMGVQNNTFNSVSNYVTFDLETVSQDGTTLTWAQSATNAASTGGVVLRPIWTRLYELSQNQLAMQNPNWQSNPADKPDRTHTQKILRGETQFVLKRSHPDRWPPFWHGHGAKNRYAGHCVPSLCPIAHILRETVRYINFQ